MKHASIVTVLALLASPAHGEGLTKLAFHWPDHLRCEVERRMRLTFGGRPGPGGDRIDRYQLEATRERGGWMIRRSYLGGIDRRTAAGTAGGRSSMADRLLSFRVRADGSFAGAVVDAATRHRLRAREAEAAALVPLPKGVPYSGSEKELTNQARGEWMDLVGSWGGGALAEGVPMEREARRELPFPPLPPTPVKFRERRQLLGRVPCSAGGPATCVELESVTESDPTSLDRALAASQRAWERGGGTAERPDEGMAGLEARKTLVTDPRTLIPARLTKTMETRFKGGGASTMEETTTFACTTVP